jgi:DNA replication protein DnaC
MNSSKKVEREKVHGKEHNTEKIISSIENNLFNVIVYFDKLEDQEKFESYVDIFLPTYFEKDNQRKELEIYVERCRNSGLEYKDESFRLLEKYETSPIRVALDAIMLSSSFFDVENYEKGIYAFHGVTISNRREGVLLLGGSGAGKTTISLNLMRNY